MSLPTVLLWLTFGCNLAFSRTDRLRRRTVPGSLERVAAARRQLAWAPGALGYYLVLLVCTVVWITRGVPLVAGLVAVPMAVCLRLDVRMVRAAWRDSRFGGWWKRLRTRAGAVARHLAERLSPRSAAAGAWGLTAVPHMRQA